MIRQYFVLFLLCHNFCSYSQSVQRDVLSSAGGVGNNGSITLQSNLGELMIETYSNTQHTITQGFEQPDPSILTNITLKDRVLNPRVLPNPVREKLSIDLDQIDPKDIIVDVYDVLGKIITTEFTKTINSDEMLELQFEYADPGIYFVRIRSEINQLDRTFKISKIL